MREGDAILPRSLGRWGPWGALRGTSASLATVALGFHLGTGIGLWQLGFDRAWFLFAVFTGALFFIGATVSIGTIGRQVRSAMRGTGWDEILVTPLTDREIVNGQLMSALRPAGLLVYMTSPSLAVLLFGMCRQVAAHERADEAASMTVGVIVGVALLYVLLGLFIYSMTVSAFLAAFVPRWSVHAMIRSLLGAVVLLIVAVAVVFVAPSLLGLIPALCWYQHRELCCSLRRRLLAGR